MRVPFIAQWPEKIPPGKTCDSLATMMDLMPTFLTQVRGTPWRSELPIDGKDIGDLLFAVPGSKTPHEAFYYYRRNQLQAVRSGNWKLHLDLKETYPRWSDNRLTGEGRSGKLINLAQDAQEAVDVAGEYPKVMDRVLKLAREAEKSLGAPQMPGEDQRKPKDIEKPVPQTLRRGAPRLNE